MKEYNKSSAFQNVRTDKVALIIEILNSEKASKSNDIRTKVIQEFGTFFTKFLTKNINSCPKTGGFFEDFKYVKVVPIHKKNDEKRATDLLVFYSAFQKYMKRARKNNLMSISRIYYQSFSVF